MTEIPEAERATSAPGRGLVSVRPREDGSIDCLCDCGLTTVLQIDLDGPLPEAREIAFTCDGCSSAHWLTLTPPEVPGD
jgi:hypothetical protein